MTNEPVYVTFEFRGNLDEEVQNVTLGIKGLRDESAKTFQRLIADSSTAFNSLSAENRKLDISVQENINALRDLVTAQKALDTELETGTLSSQKHAQSSAALAIQETNLRQSIAESMQTLNARRQTEEKAVDSVTVLTQKVRELTETYYNMSKADRDGASGQGVLTQIKELDKQIGQAEARLSKYSQSSRTRFNSLSMSVQQVARELPSLTMGANMFFLAISNNLPILSDNLKAARIEYAALKAEGQAATPVWKQVLSSIVSWQTALVIGITLLTVYGKDIVDWSKKLLNADDSQKKLNKSVEEFNVALQKENRSLQSVFSMLLKSNEGTEGRRRAINEINSLYGKYLPNLLSEKSSLEEINKAYRKITSAILENTAAKAQAQAIEKATEKNIEDQAERIETLGEKIKKGFDINTDEELNSLMNSVRRSIEGALNNGENSIQAALKGLSVLDEKYPTSYVYDRKGIYEEMKSYAKDIYDYYREISQIQKKFNPFFNKDDSNKAIIQHKKFWEETKVQAISVLESIDSEQKKLLDTGKTDGIEPVIVTAYKNAKTEIDKAAEALKIYESYDKQDKENDRLEQKLQKRLDAVQKLTDKEKQIQYEKQLFDLDMEQKGIDLLDESYRKRSEQSDLNYKKELLDIQKFADEKLKVLQEAERLEWEKGGKQGLFTPSQELPVDLLAQMEAMKAAALAAYKKTNSNIVADMDADFREERVRFQSELQKKLTDIETNYRARLKAAEGNEALIAELTKNKQKEIQKETDEHTLTLLSFYADFTKQKIALTNKFYLFEVDKRKEQLLIEKKAVEDSLKIMKKQYAEAPTQELEMQIAGAEVQLAGFNKELDQMPVDRLREALGMLRAIFTELGNLDGEIGELFSGMAGQIDNIMVAFDNTASTTDKVSAGLNGLVSVINMVTSASKKRKEVEKEFYKNAIAMAHEYALALNEQLRLQSELSGSGFVTDYVGQIKDGFNALADAQQKYDEAIKKLQEGKAKVSLRNSVDWGNVGKGVAGGAAAGAAIGSFIPVIGNAIGAVIGAVGGFFVGLFGGKKKKETFGGLLEVFPELVDASGNLNKELAESILKTDQVDDNTKQLIQNALDWAEAVEEANKQIKEIVIDLAGDLGGDLKTAIVDAWKAGEDASKKMFSAASKSLEGFLEDMLYSVVFSEVFDKFGDRLAESLNPTTGDGDILDDFDWLMGQMDAKDDTYIALLDAIKKRAAEKGYEMWMPEEKEEVRTAKAKGIESLTQDSVNLLNGNFNSMLIFLEKTNTGVTNINTLLVQGLDVLNRIATNTDRLENIESYMKLMSSNMQQILNNGLIMRKS